MGKISAAIATRWSALVRQRTLTEQLRKEVAQIPALTLEGSAASNEWLANRMKIRSLILRKNPSSFLNWEVIRYTMFVVGKQPYLLNELDHLKHSAQWTERYESAIRETSIGNPERCVHYRQSSGNLIHNAYSLNQFEECSSLKVNELDTVLEFGGGYGSMCRLFYNLGFKGKYIIYDFPEFNALQRYYLQSMQLPVLTAKDATTNSQGILCLSDLNDVKRAIPVGSKNLFLATWSLSETSEALRRVFFDTVPAFSNYLIAYQRAFGEMNNIDYFNAFTKNHSKITWKSWEIAHLKDQFYLMGYSK